MSTNARRVSATCTQKQQRLPVTPILKKNAAQQQRQKQQPPLTLKRIPAQREVLRAHCDVDKSDDDDDVDVEFLLQSRKQPQPRVSASTTTTPSARTDSSTLSLPSWLAVVSSDGTKTTTVTKTAPTQPPPRISPPTVNSSSCSTTTHNDPYNLQRFLVTHAQYFSKAMQEIKVAGKKTSCWSWYIFPVPPRVNPRTGMEEGSAKSRQYALRDIPPRSPLLGDDAARAFLTHHLTAQQAHNMPSLPSGLTKSNGSTRSTIPSATNNARMLSSSHQSGAAINLRNNLLAILRAVTFQVKVKRVNPVSLVGVLDRPKLYACCRLFERVSRDGLDPEVNQVCLECLQACAQHPGPNPFEPESQ